MSLPEGYLSYSKRQHGMDQGLYPWRPSKGRANIALPNGKQLAVFIVVPIEFFPLNPSGKPFKHPGAMATPYPDLRHYTTRDYGNRVGVYRLLRAFEAAGVKATFTVNASMLERYPPLIQSIIKGGHEIAAHGLSTDNIHSEHLSAEEEAELVAQTRAAFSKAGLSPTTWMSPARNQSFRTPSLIRAANFTTCLDWEMDQTPVAMDTGNGPLYCLPLLNELNDFNLLQIKAQAEHEWRDQIIEAADYLLAETETAGALSLGFTLTPYIAGQPFRLWAVREILSELMRRPELWVATADEISSAFEEAAL
ncbi:MAG: polysaccharide deacetylase family protein [Pseudomonadota bacterium]